MTKTIDTLIEDVYTLLGDSNKDMVFDTAKVESLGIRMAGHVKDEVQDPDRSNRDPSTVYVTQITSNCPRRRWYEYNHDKVGIPKERITGQNRFKFVYGDLIEETVLFFAELAGHDVQYRQERLTMLVQRGAETYTLAGRIDAMIDGVLVDLKSMESFSYDRFAKGTYDDKWGYGNQLMTYDTMLHNDKRYPAPADTMILGINKLNGRMHLGRMPSDPNFNVGKAVGDAVNKNKAKVHPMRQTKTASGVESLETMCAYCPFKVDCYAELGGLSVYAYAEGPKFVVGNCAKPPKVPEITKAWIQETLTRTEEKQV